MRRWQARVAPWPRCCCTMFTASCESMNSHTPSLARMKNWSSGAMSNICTSGSGITPMCLTAWSPMDRDMARPIWVISGSSHTRALRPGSGGGDTNPPAFSMRLCSVGRFGLWSLERFLAVSPPEAWVAMTALESPQLATKSLFSIISTSTAVVPLYMHSIFFSLSRRLVSTKVSFKALVGSSLKCEFLSKRSWMDDITKCDTLSPFSP
mmetsp:Transcript_3843/g.5708  ORF Transcript_3843/g.5708 Transcript_3843/m.5708 type:complete len:209 (-) Transcript_3843:572-1198(-)